MKRILVSLLVMLTVGVTAVFADDEPGVSKKVKESFKREFAEAKSVKWSNQGDYQVVTFVFDDQRAVAYYNTESGELDGTARYLMFSQLPLTVMRSFDKKFDRTAFISALEVSNAEGNFYRIIVVTQNKTYSVKVTADGYIQGMVKLKM